MSPESCLLWSAKDTGCLKLDIARQATANVSRVGCNWGVLGTRVLRTGGVRVGIRAGVSQERRGGESGTGPMCTARPGVELERLPPRIGFRSDDRTLK